MCYVYHVLRIGPFFMNFAYVYSLCHKEGHATAARTGLWAPPFDRSGPLRHVYNWWIGKRRRRTHARARTPEEKNPAVALLTGPAAPWQACTTA